MTHETTPLQALNLWRDVTVAQVGDGDVDLSTRQIALLLTIYLQTPPHTVRGLAQKLDVSKPVISRALTTMGSLDLVARRRDANDRRNVLVQRTVEGALYLDRLAEKIIASTRALGA
ncbi:MAG: MarR family transcriptional regulator [Alphaproteobacteria bacterium]